MSLAIIISMPTKVMIILQNNHYFLCCVTKVLSELEEVLDFKQAEIRALAAAEARAAVSVLYTDYDADGAGQVGS